MNTAWNKGQRLAPEALQPAEVAQLVKAASRRSTSGIRSAAIVATLFGAGLRTAEALALKPADYNPVDGTLNVRFGKGGKQRVATLADGRVELERWMERRAAIGLNGRHPLFATHKGGPLQTRYVRAMLARLAQRAGLERRVHCHGLRHAHAAHLERVGVPLTSIQSQLGHGSPVTTARYLHTLNPAARTEDIRRRWGTESKGE